MATDAELRNFLPDFPAGPLDIYRRQSSFDWRKMAVVFEGVDRVQLKMSVWRTLEEDPLFTRKPAENLSLEEERLLCFRRIKRIIEYAFYTEKHFQADPTVAQVVYHCIGMYDWSIALKKFLGSEFFIGTLRSSGTSLQLDTMKGASNFQVSGCIAITEISHGTNTRALQTTATYDPKTQEFIIHTPCLEAVKVWAGNLGELATHGAIFAQLRMPDGTLKGLHTFLVPLRDPKTLIPYSGVSLGDLGPKLGLNGIDNGFVRFDNYRVPRSSLLNRNADVSPDGKYITPYTDPNKRFGASLGSLSLGRMGIVGMCTCNMQRCLPISIRYSAIRKQFGPTPDVELPVIEYQLQQYRLFPYLAATYVFSNFTICLTRDYIEYMAAVLTSAERTPELVQHVAEMHSVTCAAKAVSAWTARDAIQESREACGGHGYLKCSGFGSLRNDNDANCTYEGDNNVLLQQTSNFLLSLWKRKEAGEEILSPMGSVTFLENADAILGRKGIHLISDITVPVVLDIYEWLMCYLMKESSTQLARELASSKDMFSARNDSQAFHCKPLSIAYIEHFLLKRLYEFVQDNVSDSALSKVLLKLSLLYGLWSLHKSHMATLYQGELFVGPGPGQLIQRTITQLCSQLKPDAVSLADAIAPPDFVLNSVLGTSDGQVYQKLFDCIQDGQKSDRVSWWSEFLDKPAINSLRPKL